MSYPCVVLDSWGAFANRAAQLLNASATRPTYLFRGQPNADWNLRPKLMRLLRDKADESRARQIEDRLRDHFEARAHHFLSPAHLAEFAKPGRPAKWMVMQHHGAPTRLLDWSESAFVAAYYACASHHDTDGVVYVVSPGSVCRANGVIAQDVAIPDQQFDKLDPKVTQVVFVTSTVLTEREIAQMGHFSISPVVLTEHDEGILKCLKPGSPSDGPSVLAARWIIPKAAKIPFLRHLRQMNIGAHSLFPGLDGLGRSIEDIAMLDAQFDVGTA